MASVKVFKVKSLHDILFLNDSRNALYKQIYCLSQPQERQPFLLSKPSLHCSLAARRKRHCLYAKGYYEQQHIVVRLIVDALTRTSTYLQMHAYIQICTRIHTLKHTHKRTNTNTHADTHTHTHRHTPNHTQTLPHPNLTTLTHTSTHTCTHTYIHTHC